MVRAADRRGVERTIDFLATIFGVASNEGVAAKAMTMDVAGANIQVLNPVHLLCSKVANLSLPGRGGPMDVEQARVAVRVLSSFAEAVAKSDTRRGRAIAKRVLQLAKSPAGWVARERYGVDAFESIQAWECMDRDFRENYFPRVRGKLDAEFARRQVHQGRHRD